MTDEDGLDGGGREQRRTERAEDNSEAVRLGRGREVKGEDEEVEGHVWWLFIISCGGTVSG